MPVDCTVTTLQLNISQWAGSQWGKVGHAGGLYCNHAAGRLHGDPRFCRLVCGVRHRPPARGRLRAGLPGFDLFPKFVVDDPKLGGCHDLVLIGAVRAGDASLICAEGSRQRSHVGEGGLPPDQSTRAVEEYLAVLDDAAFGAATPVVPSRIPPSDPASPFTAAHGGQAQFCYATNYFIDVQNAVIMDVEASTAVRQAEVTAAKRIERVSDNLGIWPRKLVADTGYGSAEMTTRSGQPETGACDEFDGREEAPGEAVVAYGGPPPFLHTAEHALNCTEPPLRVDAVQHHP